MSKQARMWLIGIIAALVIIMLIAGIASNKKGGISGTEPSSPVQETSGSPLTADSGKAESGKASEGIETDPGNSQSSVAEETDALSRYLTEQDSIMMTMKEEMLIRERSGSAAVDFLKGMIPHHEAAIKMSESYLNYGGALEELKTLAQNIIKAQKDELKQMEGMLSEYEKNGPKDDANEDAYLEKYSEMFSDDSISHHINPDRAENIDQAFAEGMMMHHQMAVDMAKDILDYTDQKEVRDLAQNIIELQEKEISQMEKLLQ